MTSHPHHAKAHTDITDRFTTWTWIPADRKPHAWRQTAWAVNDHLRCCHGCRRLINPAGKLRQMIELHARLHQVIPHNHTYREQP